MKARIIDENKSSEIVTHSMMIQTMREILKKNDGRFSSKETPEVLVGEMIKREWILIDRHEKCWFNILVGDTNSE